MKEKKVVGGRSVDEGEAQALHTPDMMTCGKCQHFDQDGHYSAGWGHCGKAKGSNGVPVNAQSIFFAEDAARYGARLNVAPDFGCNQWEEKQA